MEVHAVIRVDIKSESNVLEHTLLDESVEPTNLPLGLLQHITEDFADADDKSRTRGNTKVYFCRDKRKITLLRVYQQRKPRQISYRGYCAPEFIKHGQVSIKSDIFSLGVIITELVTGCKGNLDIQNVLRRWRYRWNKSVNYPLFGYQQVTKCIEIALKCLLDSPKKRPKISDIVSMLNALENTNEHINNVGDSLVGPISPYPWELLEFDRLELNFPFEINKLIPCSLQLTNITNDYVAFDVEMTGSLQYCIEPEKCVVPPRSKCNIMVTLQAQKRVPHAMVCKDEFFIMRCVSVNEGLGAEDINIDMFNEESGKEVDEVTLKVVVITELLVN
ncbi:uncharacterized protein LOC125507444 [Triticum urartu]|uniref:uncharacterized protein LOC125507444 n=1 Tax=Triticum urartu TaxID=4572 RepID=UPI0020438129|nr:uncharacterized protein LOC125507444 [Triticum urartu]